MNREPVGNGPVNNEPVDNGPVDNGPVDNGPVGDGPGGGEAPARSGKPEHAESRRLHPVTPWRRAWAPIAAMVGIALQDVERTRDVVTQLTVGWSLFGAALLLPIAAAYGFLSWWYTSYVVTETELRIRTGLLFRRTAHIRLDRIQTIDVDRPLLARVAQVAKLKLDVVGARSKDELAFLGEREAIALRAELLARAAGMAPDAAPDVGEAPSRELLRVRTRTLVTSVLLLGGSWAALVAAAAVAPLAYLASGSVWPALVITVPLLGVVWNSSVGRLVKEFGWTVAESPDGLRLDHGLLDREHATVPPGRVQAVRLLEPLGWRRRGWVRVELRVAGADTDDIDTLLPVATRADAARVVGRVLPDVDLAEAVASVTPVPRRARWGAPLRWRGYGYVSTDTVFVTRAGLLRRRTTLVPHAKVQSLRYGQGPWERRLRLARVSVDHGANGAATAWLRDAAEARAIVAAQTERSRTGRRTALPDRWLT